MQVAVERTVRDLEHEWIGLFHQIEIRTIRVLRDVHGPVGGDSGGETHHDLERLASVNRRDVEAIDENHGIVIRSQNAEGVALRAGP